MAATNFWKIIDYIENAESDKINRNHDFILSAVFVSLNKLLLTFILYLLFLSYKKFSSSIEKI